MAFRYYDTPTPVSKPTIKEMVASLTAGERGDILKAFRRENVTAQKASRHLLIQFEIVDSLFKELDQIENRASAYVRREVVVAAATYDAEGVELTPVVYNTAVTSVTNLRTRIYSDFSDDFTQSQITAIVNAMVSDSKRDGSGTWTFYVAEVIK